MQFIWPFKGDFRIIWLEPDYSVTVIGREKRDYVWIMARSPQIPDEKYEEIVAYLAQTGYDVGKLQRVPQRWPAQGGSATR
jgi:apolipoprotein D and lipocalin family protein